MVAALALIGLGAFVLTHFKLDVLPIEAFGVGLGTALGTLEIYQLFRPIDFLVVIFLFLIGSVELARRPTLYYLLVLHVRSIKVSRIAFGLFLLLSLAIRSAGPCEHYDTGLYGANTVRWFTTYSIVPGLANLHGRFGFNSSLFLLVAAFNKVLGSLSYRILDGIFIAILAVLIVAAIDRLLRNASRPEDLYLLILTIPVVYWVERAELVGTNTDLPSTICCLLAVYFVFATVSSKAKGKASLRLFSACVLFSAAVVLKLSTIVLAALGFVICISVFLSVPETRAKRRHWIIATMVGSVPIPVEK